MTQVADALMPILCSIEPQRTPLPGPTAPSSLTLNFGTMNRLMPWMPGGPPVMRALHRHIRGCPPPLEIADGGHFLQEWGGPIAEAALTAL